jgi:hypothetical protein
VAVNPEQRDRSTRARDPDTEPIKAVGAGERQRAAIALGVLAIVALIVVGIMVAVLGRGSGDDNSTTNSANGPKGPAVTVTGGSRPTHHQTKHSSGPKHTHQPQQPSSRPSGAPVTCPTSAPCDLPDDVGNVVSALNAYRTSHGKPAVRGSVTKAARTCAVSNGDTCPNGFYWEPVERSGKQVIQKISAGGGDSWLLDDRMTAVQVGWAYIPSSQSFECAVVSNAP